MTVNINTSPNHIVINGDTRVSHFFGSISAVTPVPHCTHPHVDIWLNGHVHLSFSTATMRELVRRCTEALVSMPFPVEAVRDSVGEEQA